MEGRSWSVIKNSANVAQGIHEVASYSLIKLIGIVIGEKLIFGSNITGMMEKMMIAIGHS